MRCPFLREAQVKFCRASAFRKMIVRLPGQPDNERCSTPAYVNCPAARLHREEHPSIDHCPFLNESLVQYCSAATVTKYIPYSESVLSQCGTESHKFCELFLALAHPPHAAFPDEDNRVHSHTGTEAEHVAQGIRIPEALWFAPNHMWLDVGADGVLHIGVDAFLASVMGEIDRLTYVTPRGVGRPTAVLTVQGVDLQMTFPNQVNIMRPNTYLRTNPAKILSDPYGSGWLFEASEAGKQSPSRAGLIPGKDACAWMEAEVRRMTEYAHDLATRPSAHGAVLMADGGCFHPGLVHDLTREECLEVANAFFSPLADWRKPS